MGAIHLTDNLASREAARLFFGGADNSGRLRVSSRVLKTVINKELTGRQREAINLYYYKNMKQREIAALWMVDQSAVSRHLSRARRRIKRCLDCLMCLDTDYPGDSFN